MQTLDEFNKQRMKFYQSNNISNKNGIACPKCGEEMFDSSPNVTLTSNPPQKNVACKCGYRGYRIA